MITREHNGQHKQDRHVTNLHEVWIDGVWLGMDRTELVPLVFSLGYP